MTHPPFNPETKPQKTIRTRKILFGAILLCCALPFVKPWMSLLAGSAFAMTMGNPWPSKTGKWSKILLQLSVVGLGFSLKLKEIAETGKDYFFITLIGISLTLLLGYLLGRFFKTEKNTSLLLSFGTAICGGSAIAAMAPVIKAKDHEIAVSLATVFTLNAVALLLFPAIGHLMALPDNLFGAWAGLAIHDTSSVVGAASTYSKTALSLATTVKLTRALWITPVVVIASLRFGVKGKIPVPLFIIGFVAAATVGTLLPEFSSFWSLLSSIARQALVVTLFLIGGGLTREVLKVVGFRPMLQGVTLWAIVSFGTLGSLWFFGAG